MKNELWATALRVGARLTVWIAAPVILASFAGKYLDKRYNSEPWLFLSAVGLAFCVSMYGLITNALKEFRRIENEESAKKKTEAGAAVSQEELKNNLHR